MTGFYEWKKERLVKRKSRQSWSLRAIRDLLQMFRQAEEQDVHIEINGYVECNTCFASTPLDMVIDATGLHLERMAHGNDEYGNKCPCQKPKENKIHNCSNIENVQMQPYHKKGENFPHSDNIENDRMSPYRKKGEE